MQALSRNSKTDVYNPPMPGGRPRTKPASDFGRRLTEARQQAGLTQQQVAERLGVTQKLITYWERESVGLKAEQLSAMAQALGTTLDFLIGQEAAPKRRGGPQGRTKQVFDQVSSLPRDQQSRVLDMIETIVAGQAARRQTTKVAS